MSLCLSVFCEFALWVCFVGLSCGFALWIYFVSLFGPTLGNFFNLIRYIKMDHSLPVFLHVRFVPFVKSLQNLQISKNYHP